MKKLIILVMLLTLSLSFSYAQATVGGWGRGIFAPVIMADGDPTAASMISWGPGGTRIGFTVSGSSDNVGFQADVLVDNGAVGVGDVQKIWVKPIEVLTISVGSLFDDTLRGSAAFVAYNWLRYDSIVGDGAIFNRAGEVANDTVNAEIAIAPVDGLYIFAAFGGNGGIDLQNAMWGGPIRTEDMFKQAQYAVGYDIPGVGLARAQFIGQPTAIDEPWGLIQAAFKVTAVEGLLVDIGGTYYLDPAQDGDNRMASVALYGKYIMDTLTIHLVTDVTVYDADLTADKDMGLGLGLGVEYGLEGGLTAQLDVRYRNESASGWADGEIGIGAFAKFSYSNGIFGIGVQATNGNFANWGSSLVDKTDPTAMVFALPIRLEYWF